MSSRAALSNVPRAKARGPSRKTKAKFAIGDPKGWFPFPKSVRTKHVYAEVVAVNPGTGVVGDYVFSANGMFDPNITGTGHQPYGFDTLSAMYNHYTVISARCSATIHNNDASFPFWFAVQLRDSVTSASGSDTSAIIEQPGIAYKMVSVQTANLAVQTVRMSYDAKSFHGVTNVDDADNLQGSASANPSEQAYFHVMMCPYVGTDDIGSKSFWVIIEYESLWQEPQTLAQS